MTLMTIPTLITQVTMILMLRIWTTLTVMTIQYGTKHDPGDHDPDSGDHVTPLTSWLVMMTSSLVQSGWVRMEVWTVLLRRLLDCVVISM